LSAFITIDFSRVADPDGPQPAAARRDKLTRSRETLPLTALEKLLPSVEEAAPGSGVTYPPEMLEAAKATFTSSGGNVAEVSRVHNLHTATVTRLAAKHEWPVYGHGTSVESKSKRTKLMTIAGVLENKLFQLTDAMGIEKKQLLDVTEKGLNSQYVAPLNQRSTAFSAVFDRYMRVMAILEPELFAADDDPSNPVAAKIRQKQHRDALGGVDGVDRRMADFAARVAVATLDAVQRPGAGEVIDAEVIE